MAQTTTALLQAALNTITGHDVGSSDPVKILQETHDGTYSRWYVTGNPSTVSSPAVILSDRAMWCLTTVSGNAAAQAAEIIAAMTATAGTINGNVDPDIGP